MQYGHFCVLATANAISAFSRSVSVPAEVAAA
jgi:hypothetical protein